MNYLKALVVAIALTGCASSNHTKKELIVLKSDSSDCRKIAVLKSTGFSLVPFLGKYMANSMLEEKAKSMNANAIIITKETGFFQTDLEGYGLRCKDFSSIKV